MERETFDDVPDRDYRVLPEDYTSFYILKKHDSPDASRASLVGAIRRALQEVLPNPCILDIGAGRQALESQFFTAVNSPEAQDAAAKKVRFVSLDAAKIAPYRLLTHRSDMRIPHVQADALALPFRDAAFGMVISNLAIDFLPKAAFREARRVLAPGGLALFNFHHPQLLPSDLRLVGNINTRGFWQYLQKNRVLFENEEQIRACLGERGFTNVAVGMNEDRQGKWWEVSAAAA